MNINLVFNANTQQVKAQLNELKTSLNGLSNTINLNNSMSSFNKQTNAALGSLANLRAMLDQATTSSGQLNISKFSLSMQKAGISLASLRKDLSEFGAEGEKAFLQLSRSILDAQQPMKQTNQIIDKLWGSMKNVATWQVSSRILYGFMGQISNAYQYTQDLNESLNNIRIVTGYGADEMSKFAEQANKAAKALSASTLEYTDAALIYYQQGLTGKEVTERADTTIKLANVARTSGEEASEWMTAIWNNFDNGSKSLEYYADVLTKLGADTASSADEIAGGLEKFSAVANTVGLSYEYAAAALATITAQTRQSEDVVGTSLKTLFARIENLSLGNTLDDGTTLNQYSEALYKVGINIKDASGELKDMDAILNEMGATWGTLSKDQQVALAQTVGGIRQYNQLIALMDNWDFFEQNVDRAKNATGELNKQNEIYAESWEAANKRVKASAEGLYQSILKDDFFIKLTNMTADFVEGLDKIIDSVGGLKTILPSLVLLFSKLFGQKIIVGAKDLAYNISLTSKQAQQRNAEFKMSATSNALEGGDLSASEYTKAATGALQRQDAITQALAQGTRELTQAELDHINILKQRLNLQEELFQKNQKKLDHLNDEELPDAESRKNKAKTEYRNFQEKQSRKVSESYQETRKLGKKTVQIDAQKFQSALRTSDEVTDFIEKLEAGGVTLDGYKAKLKKAYGAYQELMESNVGLALKEDLDSATEEVDKLKNKIKATADAGAEMEESIKEASDAMVEDIKIINTNYGWDQAFMGLINGAMSAAMAIGMLQTTIDTLQDPDTTGMEKFTSVLMMLGSTIPMVLPLLKLLFSETTRNTLAKNLDSLAEELNAKAKEKTARASKKKQSALDQENNKLDKNTRKNIKNSASENLDGDGASAKGLKGKMKGGWKDLGSKAGGFLKAAAPYAAAAAIIISAGFALKALSDYMDRANTKAKEAAESAKLLADNYATVKQQHEEFISSFSGYQEGIDGLSQLTKGTTEYKEALAKANEEAMNMIKNSESLKDKYYVDTLTGEIKFEEGALEEAKAASLQKQINAQNASIAADQYAQQAQFEADRTKLLRKADAGSNVGWSSEDKLGASAMTAGAGTIGLGVLGATAATQFWNPVGWAAIIAGVGLAVGGAIATAIGDETASEQEAVDELTSLYELYGDALFDKNEGVELAKKVMNDKFDDKFIETLYKDIDALKEVVQSNYDLAESNKLANLQKATNELSDNETIQRSAYADQVTKLTANIIDANTDAALNKLEEEGWGTANINKASTEKDKDAQKVWKEYAEAAGLDISKAILTGVTGTDNNRKFVYELDGESKTVNLETMRAVKASADALKDIDGSAEGILSKISNIGSTGNAGDNAFIKYMADDGMSTMTKNEFDALRTVINSYGGILNYIDEKLEGDKNGEVSDTTAKIYFGADTGEQAKKEYEAREKAQQEVWNKIGDNLSNQAKRIFAANKQVIDSMTLGEAQSYAKLYDTTLSQGGVSATTSLANIFKDAGKDAPDLLSKIQSINWAQTSLYEASKEVESVVDTSSAEWKIYAENMIRSAKATKVGAESFEFLLSKLSQIQDIVKDLKLGEVITDEEYKKIISKNKALADSFVRVANGWRLITDPENIKDTIINELGKDYEEAINNAEKYRDFLTTTTNENKEDTLNYIAGYIQTGNEAEQRTTARKQITEINKVATSDENLELLTKKAGVTVDAYNQSISAVNGGYATQQQLEDIEKVYNSYSDLLKMYKNGSLESTNITTAFADQSDTLSELNTSLENYQATQEDSEKSYDNYISKKTTNLDITQEELTMMKAQVRGLKDLDTALKNDARFVGLVAVENEELQQGMVTLIEKEEEFIEALNSGNRDVITGELAESVSKVLGEEVDYNFIINNLEIIKRLMNGEVDAIDDLQQAYAYAQIAAGNYTETQKQQLYELVNGDFNINIGANINLTDVFNSLMALHKDINVAIAEMNELYGSSFKIEYTRDKDDNIIRVQGIKIRSNSPLISGAVNQAKNKKSESSNKPDDFDPKRYHKIDEVLDDIGRKLDIIKEKRDRAFGIDKLQYFNQELEMMTQDLEATEEKLRQANEYYAADRNAILKYGVQLDEAGRITNYDEVRQRYYQQYASNPEAYADAWNKVNEELDRYEETLNLTEELEQEKLDKWYAIQDLKLENIEYEVTFNIEASEDTMKYLDLILKELDDDAYDAAKAIETLGEKTVTTAQDIEAYRKGISNILKGANFTDEEVQKFFNGDGSIFDGKTLTQDQVDKLREYRDNLTESTDALKEYRDQVYEIALNAFTAWNEKFDENANKIERANKLLETHQNLIEITGKKYLGVDNELLESISKSRVALSQSNLQNSVANFEANKQALEKAQADLAKMEQDRVSEDTLKKQQELIKEIEQTTADSEQEMMDNLVATMELAGKVFEDTVDRVMETLNDALGNITELQDQFDKQRKIEELYLAEHKKLYEINKLNRDIQKSIDQTDNVKAQRELAEIAEEVMSYQSEGANMSKYDLEYLQKRYDLKKAEIALEEAQNAKNQVKLQRDSKGNWGYVYTADQGNINKAQEDYDKALYEIQEFSYQSERELTEKYLSLQQEMIDELKKLRIEDYSSREEYLARVAEIQNHYTQLSNATLMEIKDLTYQNSIVNRDYATTMADTYHETLIGRMYPSYQNFEELSTGISDSLKETLTSLGEAYTIWSLTVNEAMAAAKIGPEQFVDYMTNIYVPKMQETADRTSQNAQQIKDDMIRYLLGENGQGGAIGAVSQFISNFETEMGKIDEVANNVNKAMQDISNAASGAMDQLSRDLSNMRDMINEMYQLAATGSGLVSQTPPTTVGNDDEGKTTTLPDGSRKSMGGGRSVKGSDIKANGTGTLDPNTRYVPFKNADGTISYYKTSDVKVVDGETDIFRFKEGATPAFTTNPSTSTAKTKYYLDTNQAHRGIALDPTTGTPYAKLDNGKWYKLSWLDTSKLLSSDPYVQFKSGHNHTEGLTNFSGATGDLINIKWWNGQKVHDTWSNTDGKLIKYSNSPLWDYISDTDYGSYEIYPNQFDEFLLPKDKNDWWYKLLAKYDTGGYTGSWGADGRLAMLHQKEIVLNSHDTENFLSAVKIVRSMSDMLEKNAAVASQGLQIERWMTNILGQRQSIDQNVTIEAHFPNVTDRYEIEQAFNSLVNDASQYANRK